MWNEATWYCLNACFNFFHITLRHCQAFQLFIFSFRKCIVQVCWCTELFRSTHRNKNDLKIHKFLSSGCRARLILVKHRHISCMIIKALEIRIMHLHLPEESINLYFADSSWSLCVHNNLEMMPQVAAKKHWQETDFKLCVQFQKPDAHELVSEPLLEAYTMFLNFIRERWECRDAEYLQHIWQIEHITATYLKDMKEKWHRTCIWVYNSQ